MTGVSREDRKKLRAMHGKEGHLAACETGHVDCPTNRILDALDEAEQRAQKVRELHQPEDTEGDDPRYRLCRSCSTFETYEGERVNYPCPTIRALDGETPQPDSRATIAGVILPCATSPERTAMFVGDGPKDDRESNWRYARQLCRSCPVLTECRAMVLTDEANGNPHIGVAGGLLPSERKGAFRDLKERTRARTGIPADGRFAECGTKAARARHRRMKEECAICEEGLRNRQDERAEQRLPCGTTAAARRHESAGEPLCYDCRESRNEERRLRYEKRRMTVDTHAVECVVEGEAMPLNRREKHIAMVQMTARGHSASEIAKRVETTQRAVVRARARARQTSTDQQRSA
jgi:hypothetical protein